MYQHVFLCLTVFLLSSRLYPRGVNVYKRRFADSLDMFLGSEVSFAECRRTDDGSPVNEEKCDAGQKPPRATVHCNYQPCPPV